MTRPKTTSLSIATLLAAGALGLLGVGLAAGAEVPEQSYVLGTTVEQPDAIPFRTPEAEEIQIFFDKINALRAERGVDPLIADAELELTATAWAASMSQTRQLEHADDLSLGVTADWRKLGENVGVAPERQHDELFEAFVASPTHLANLVDPSFDMVGIGVVHADGQLWMTQRFMDLSPEALGVDLG